MLANTRKLFETLVGELIIKAATAPFSLTYPECRLIRHDSAFCERMTRVVDIYIR